MSALQTGSAPTTKATTSLTLTRVLHLERQKCRAGALLVFLVSLSFIWLCLQPGNAPRQVIFGSLSNLINALACYISSYWVLCTVYRTSRGPLLLGNRYRVSWILTGTGLFVYGLGSSYTGLVLLFSGNDLQVPSYADLAFTLSHSLLLTGLFLLPIQAKNERSGIHIVIDALITTLCFFSIYWFFTFQYMFGFAEMDHLWARIILFSYPCWDISLMMAFILFAHRRPASIDRLPLLIYGLGVLAFFWADSARAGFTSSNHYIAGKVAIDPFWSFSALLIGIAALYQYSALASYFYRSTGQRHTFLPSTATLLPFEHRFVLLQSLMIYLPFSALLLLTLYSQFVSDAALTHSLDILGGVVLFLLITHYALATYENARLLHEKEQRRTEAELLRRATASLSSVLEMDLLLSHIVTVGATELGFESAALVLIEDYQHALNEQSALLARATTPGQDEAVAAWRLTGQKISSCLALMGQEIEVRWAEVPLHVSTPVHQWHINQRMQSSLFVPLMYQGKLQGSVVFSITVARSFSAREHYLARAFATEAANAIEHARLYEFARENALFAQAMTNVAARLNSVVAIGMGLGSEIHHLICTEGALALQADLAILYIHQSDGLFVPQAAVSTKAETSTTHQEWPAITIDGSGKAFAHSAQPILLSMRHPASPSQSTDSRLALHHCPSPERAIKHPGYMSEPEMHTVSFGSASRNQGPFASHAFGKLLQLHLHQFNTLREALRHHNVATALLAPLIIHKAQMGLLVLARISQPGKEKRDFGTADLVPAQDFASQAAIAFTNACLYEQLHTAHRRLQELDQLKDQFMVTASHELRTPLTAVQGYLELLEHYRTSLSSEQQQEFVEKASRGCEELVLLLNNVMDASRLEIEAGIRPTHLEHVSLRDVVENVVDLILLQATREHRDIQISISSQLMVRADPTRLRQVIRNLSVNALKYSPLGTPLTFSARPFFNQTASIVLSVSDRGPGIRPEDQPKLFQRFVRLERDLNSTVRGSGLGLYISRRLIEAMNGRIWVESTGIPGEGCTFCIQLPMV